MPRNLAARLAGVHKRTGQMWAEAWDRWANGYTRALPWAILDYHVHEGFGGTLCPETAPPLPVDDAAFAALASSHGCTPGEREAWSTWGEHLRACIARVEAGDRTLWPEHLPAPPPPPSALVSALCDVFASSKGFPPAEGHVEQYRALARWLSLFVLGDATREHPSRCPRHVTAA